MRANIEAFMSVSHKTLAKFTRIPEETEAKAEKLVSLCSDKLLLVLWWRMS